VIGVGLQDQGCELGLTRRTRNSAMAVMLRWFILSLLSADAELEELPVGVDVNGD